MLVIFSLLSLISCGNSNEELSTFNELILILKENEIYCHTSTADEIDEDNKNMADLNLSCKITNKFSAMQSFSVLINGTEFETPEQAEEYHYFFETVIAKNPYNQAEECIVIDNCVILGSSSLIDIIRDYE